MRLELGRQEEPSAVGAAAGSPLFMGAGSWSVPGGVDVSFLGGCFFLFIVFRFERTPSSLCHNHDLPANTPPRAKENKSIVGVGAKLQLKFPGLTLITKPRELSDVSCPQGKPLF